MKSMVIAVILVASALYCTAYHVRALECNLDSRANQRELQQMIELCTQKNSNDQSTTDEYDSNEEDSRETSTYGYRDPSLRYKRNNDTHQETTTSTPTTTTITTTTMQEMEMNTTESHKQTCTIQCLLTQLGVVDSSGYPAYELMSQILLKRATNRELRDFIQDITNDCFQLMGQGEKQEACEYSTSLVKCLAQKGRENCADWPIGSLTLLE